MELGEKLRQARIEAGMSQRQLCGDAITRNMLSQVEHGTARPSMDTLRYLAGRLGKPVSFFLEENAVLSPNQERMSSARALYAAGAFRDAWNLLQEFQKPDPVLEWEWNYFSGVTAGELARETLLEGKTRYAGQILEQAAAFAREIPELNRHRLLLLGKLPNAPLAELVRQLPSLDEELLLRAETALLEENPQRAVNLLMAAENRESPRWNLLCGQALTGLKRHAEALLCLEKAEEMYPRDCWPMLEICFREQGDFEKAYFYACRQR